MSSDGEFMEDPDGLLGRLGLDDDIEDPGYSDFVDDEEPSESEDESRVTDDPEEE